MTRYLYPGNLVLLASGVPAASLPFTVWDLRTGGTDVTAQLTAPDGVTTYDATTDGIGQQLPFRGPDGWRQSLWLDSGVSQRYRLESSEVADSDVVDQQSLDSRVAALEAGGGGGAVTIVATSITDSGTAGRAVLRSEAAVDARTAIGAGTYTAPAFIAAGATAAAARTAVGFDAAARAATGIWKMLWNTTTNTWWGYDPATNTLVNGAPRVSTVPQGGYTYYARNDAAATLPTGAQAPLPVSPNGMEGDEFKLHQSSSLIP